ncbi:MAG: Arylsulfatase [Verrucomicrobiota bacterium]
MAPHRLSPLRFLNPGAHGSLSPATDTMRLIACLLACLALASPAAPAPLNFIVVLIDDMGATDLACTGSTFHQTPHIDQLAREGMRFDRAFSACTVCSPTRAALLTGQSPARTRITDWIAGHERPKARLLPPEWCKELPEAITTLPEALRSKSYASATIGKWHLGNASPLQHGFNRNAGGYHRGQPETWFAPYRNPALKDGPDGEFLTERLTTEAIRFMTEHKDRPFFVYLPHYSVHTPLGGKPEVIAQYRSKVSDNTPHRNPVYAAMVASVDDSIGQLRKAVRDLALADRTVFIFTSDNGGLLGSPRNPITSNLGLRAGKGSPWEGGVRVPLLIDWPGLTKAGSVCHDPVITMDLAVTIAHAAGSPLPEPVDGTNLQPALRGEPLPSRPLCWHYPHYHPGGASPYSAILLDGWRLVRFLEDGHEELYHVASDPAERTECSAQHPDRRDRLATALDQWLAHTKAQSPRPNPDFQPPAGDAR